MDPKLLSVGQSINIKRSNGRVHAAAVSSIDEKKKFVSVEWFEHEETKGKEVDFEAVYAMNTELFTVQKRLEYEKAKTKKKHKKKSKKEPVEEDATLMPRGEKGIGIQSSVADPNIGNSKSVDEGESSAGMNVEKQEEDKEKEEKEVDDKEVEERDRLEAASELMSRVNLGGASEQELKQSQSEKLNNPSASMKASELSLNTEKGAEKGAEKRGFLSRFRSRKKDSGDSTIPEEISGNSVASSMKGAKSLGKKDSEKEEEEEEERPEEELEEEEKEEPEKEECEEIEEIEDPEEEEKEEIEEESMKDSSDDDDRKPTKRVTALDSNKKNSKSMKNSVSNFDELSVKGRDRAAKKGSVAIQPASEQYSEDSMNESSNEDLGIPPPSKKGGTKASKPIKAPNLTRRATRAVIKRVASPSASEQEEEEEEKAEILNRPVKALKKSKKDSVPDLSRRATRAVVKVASQSTEASEQDEEERAEIINRPVKAKLKKDSVSDLSRRATRAIVKVVSQSTEASEQDEEERAEIINRPVKAKLKKDSVPDLSRRATRAVVKVVSQSTEASEQEEEEEKAEIINRPVKAKLKKDSVPDLSRRATRAVVKVASQSTEASEQDEEERAEFINRPVKVSKKSKKDSVPDLSRRATRAVVKVTSQSTEASEQDEAEIINHPVKALKRPIKDSVDDTFLGKGKLNILPVRADDPTKKVKRKDVANQGEFLDEGPPVRGLPRKPGKKESVASMSSRMPEEDDGDLDDDDDVRACDLPRKGIMKPVKKESMARIPSKMAEEDDGDLDNNDDVRAHDLPRKVSKKGIMKPSKKESVTSMSSRVPEQDGRDLNEDYIRDLLLRAHDDIPKRASKKESLINQYSEQGRVSFKSDNLPSKEESISSMSSRIPEQDDIDSDDEDVRGYPFRAPDLPRKVSKKESSSQSSELSRVDLPIRAYEHPKRTSKKESMINVPPRMFEHDNGDLDDDDISVLRAYDLPRKVNKKEVMARKDEEEEEALKTDYVAYELAKRNNVVTQRMKEREEDSIEEAVRGYNPPRKIIKNLPTRGPLQEGRELERGKMGGFPLKARDPPTKVNRTGIAGPSTRISELERAEKNLPRKVNRREDIVAAKASEQEGRRSVIRGKNTSLYNPRGETSEQDIERPQARGGLIPHQPIRTSSEPVKEEGRLSEPPSSSKSSDPLLAGKSRKSSCVKEVERLKRNREERRNKAKIESQLHKGNEDYPTDMPNLAFYKKIREFRSRLQMTPMTGDEPVMPAKICVCVRKRPLNKKENSRKEIDVVSVPDQSSIVIHEPKTKVDLTKYLDNQYFIFDYAFDITATNELVYRYTAQPLVHTVFDKGMATCFAYGQTGSGKTHTMGGVFSGRDQDATRGIYALAAADVFALNRSPANMKKDLTVHSSFFEIYGSGVFDLLNKKTKLRVLEDRKQQVQVVGLEEKMVHEVSDVLRLIHLGNSCRTSGTTSANQNSSRSHAVFQIILRKRIGGQLYGKFSLIDLAGNERGADTASSDRQTRMEGAEINKSLLALKECIRALSRKGAHLPFRGSKLTLVLKDSFMGENSRTCMIAMISPGFNSCEHTLNTLRYADRVKELRGGGISVSSSEMRQHQPDGLLDRGIQADLHYLHSTLDTGDADLNQSSEILTFHEAINNLVESEELLIEEHKAIIKADQYLLEEEKDLLGYVDTSDHDIEQYVTRLERIISQKVERLSSFKDRIEDLQKRLSEEETASKKIRRLPMP